MHREATLGIAVSGVLLFLWFFWAPFHVWVDLKYDFIAVPWAAVSCSFLVLLVVAIALARLPHAIRSGWLHDRGVVFWCWVGIGIFALMCMGPVIRYGNLDLAIGPYALLYRFMPGFHNMQVPGRLCVLLLPLVIILAATSIDRLLGLFDSPKWRGIIASIAGILLLTDLAVEPYGFQRVPLQADIPAAFRWLSETAEPGGVLVLPTDTIERQRSPLYLYFALYHRHPMLNGYASFIPSDCASALHKARSFPEREALDRLEQRGVRYVVIDRLELEHDVGASALAAKLEECERSTAVRRVAVSESDSRFVLYEILRGSSAAVE